jgi:type II secretory ATPase GspE/PulE/Tfp pilus assembly ATPase PilB-like protein
MPVSDAVGDAIVELAPAAEVQAIAVSEGMTTLAADGILKAMNGLTSIEELLRVAG